jgi:predicted DNA binding CopG/RHH family protein
MTEKRMSDDELAEEARRWDNRENTPTGWEEAPDAVPRAKESIQINIRLPRQMVTILKEFARRSGVGYQVLMKRWLDERIRQERARFRREQERLRRERERAQCPPIIKLAVPPFDSRAAVFGGGSVSDLPKAEALRDTTTPI